MSRARSTSRSWPRVGGLSLSAERAIHYFTISVVSGVQLTIDGREEPLGGAGGPKDARVGDIVTAERARWSVEGLVLERREAICRLLGGSRALRRFGARAIVRVERGGFDERWPTRPAHDDSRSDAPPAAAQRADSYPDDVRALAALLDRHADRARRDGTCGLEERLRDAAEIGWLVGVCARGRSMTLVPYLGARAANTMQERGRPSICTARG